jgi:SAM-dependent methyltransferase
LQARHGPRADNGAPKSALQQGVAQAIALREGSADMDTREVFDANAARYDEWFERHRLAYLSELLALRAVVPCGGRGLEIGVGGGRFAAPLGIATGVDPAAAMLVLAAARGVDVVRGRAEALPFARASFDHALAVTTLCFVESPPHMLAEARRVLRPGGRLVIGFIDRASPLGREYVARSAESAFYRDAHFYSAVEVGALLERAGFVVEAWAQTLSCGDPAAIEPARPGYGEGGFVAVAARVG